MAKTQELVQDTINDLFSTTEKLKMRNSIKDTNQHESEQKRSLFLK